MPAPTTELSAHHRIEFPKELSDELKWKPGQKLMLIRSEDGVFICPEVTFAQMRGIAKGANTEGYRDRNDRY